MSYTESLVARAEQAKATVKQNPGQSLKIVLEGLPVRKKKLGKDPTEEQVRAAQDAASAGVLSILVGIDTKVLGKAISELDEEEVDTLMKYIYRGFGETSYDYAILLKAHDEICKLYGNGPIIRTIHTQLEV